MGKGDGFGVWKGVGFGEREMKGDRKNWESKPLPGNQIIILLWKKLTWRKSVSADFATPNTWKTSIFAENCYFFCKNGLHKRTLKVRIKTDIQIEATWPIALIQVCYDDICQDVHVEKRNNITKQNPYTTGVLSGYTWNHKFLCPTKNNYFFSISFYFFTYLTTYLLNGGSFYIWHKILI